MRYLVCALMFCCVGCSFFEKRESNDEIVDLASDVLKSDKGVEITIKPIDVPYKK